MLAEDKILNYLKFNGPSLAINVAKGIGEQNLLASAFLSELASRKKVRISHLKIGSSPLYFLPGQEPQLLNYSKDLKAKDQEILAKLGHEKILREKELELLEKVVLRALKDFAVPLQVTFAGQKELFWKWYLLDAAEANNRIALILSPEVLAPEQEKEAAEEKVEKKVEEAKKRTEQVEKKQELVEEKEKLLAKEEASVLTEKGGVLKKEKESVQAYPPNTTVKAEEEEKQAYPPVTAKTIKKTSAREEGREEKSSELEEDQAEKEALAKKKRKRVKLEKAKAKRKKVKKKKQVAGAQKKKEEQVTLVEAPKEELAPKAVEVKEESKELVEQEEKEVEVTPLEKEISEETPEKVEAKEDSAPKQSLVGKLKEKLIGKRRKKVNDEFLPVVQAYLDKMNIELVEHDIVRKNAEINLTIKVSSVVGTMTYFCKAKNKKRCDERDLSAAYMEAQMKKMPLLFLYPEGMTKRAEEFLASGAFDNLMAKKMDVEKKE